MAVFNPFVPSFKRDPYRALARLRADEPAHYSETLQAWVLTRHADCLAVLRDHETFSSDTSHARSQLAGAIEERRRLSPLGMTPTVLNSDPPSHARLRGIVNRAFTPRRVAGLRPRIEEIARELLAEVDGESEFELMAGLAVPLPVIVIAELLGVPSEDRELFRQWSNAVAAATNVVTSEEIADEAREATRALVDYLGRVVEQRRGEPRDDLLSALVEAEEEGQRLSHEEVLAFAILLLVAGNETTTNLIGNGTLALIADAEQQQAMRAGGEALSGGIEEMLRFDSPVQALVRFTRRDAEIAGRTIAAGNTVMLMIGAANRDPEAFADPDRFDVGRPDASRHLSFGMGIHYCLGSPLARLEAEVAFTALLDRFDSMELVTERSERGGTFLLRGLDRLTIRPAERAR